MPNENRSRLSEALRAYNTRQLLQLSDPKRSAVRRVNGQSQPPRQLRNDGHLSRRGPRRITTRKKITERMAPQIVKPSLRKVVGRSWHVATLAHAL
jgi:hypothetical protein